MKKIVLAGLLSVAAILGTGCGDACEKATNRFEDKQKECGLPIREDTGDVEEVECTDALADEAEKAADCIEKASCDQVKDGSFLTSCGT